MAKEQPESNQGGKGMFQWATASERAHGTGNSEVSLATEQWKWAVQISRGVPAGGRAGQRKSPQRSAGGTAPGKTYSPSGASASCCLILGGEARG